MARLSTATKWTPSSPQHRRTTLRRRPRQLSTICSSTTFLLRTIYVLLLVLVAILWSLRSLFTYSTLEEVSYTAMASIGVVETASSIPAIHPRYVRWINGTVDRANMWPRKEWSTYKPPLTTPKNATMYKLPPNLVRVYRNADKEVCVPVEEWLTEQRPTCNSLHEMVSDVADFKFVNRGSASYVMGMQGNHEVVVKGSLYKKDMDTARLRKRHMEARVQEHFTSSDFVSEIYSHCAFSYVAPFAPGGSLYDYIVSMKYYNEPKLSAIDKLKIAVHMATGVAAIHELNGKTPNATFTTAYAHNDLDTNQYIYHNGVFQLTDFNYGKQLLKRYGDNNVPACYQSPGMHPYLFRSPEDLAYAFGDYIREEEWDHLGDKESTRMDIKAVATGKDQPFDYSQSDVYGMGSAMHAMWTLRWMWNNDDLYGNSVRLMRGERPSLDVMTVMGNETQDDNSIKAYSAIAKAIEMAWTHDPSKRPTAEHITKYLREQLAELLGLASPNDITLQHLQMELPKPKKPDNGAKNGDEADPEFKKFLRL